MRLRDVISAVALATLLTPSVACRDSFGYADETVAAAEPPQATVALPNKSGTYKFGVLGDFGTGSREQYDLAKQMANVHARFKFEHVILVGDNLYGSERPQDFKKKFEIP